MKSNEEIFLHALKKSGVCVPLDDDVFYFGDLRNFGGLKNFVVAMDGFCENVHFLKNWLAPEQAARKAFLVNISDIVAKNATPKFALVSLVLPKNFNAIQILKISDSIASICKSWGVQILGGDTMSGQNLEFHITMFGKLNAKIVRRGIGRIGGVGASGGFGNVANLRIYATQDRKNRIGGSLKNLRQLLRFQKSRAEGRFLQPYLRVGFMAEASKFIVSSMDISDGLAQDLPKMLDKFGVRFSKKFCKIARFQKLVLQSGEEYEILFCAHARHAHALQNLARKHRIQLLEIGTLKHGATKFNPKPWH